MGSLSTAIEQNPNALAAVRRGPQEGTLLDATAEAEFIALGAREDAQRRRRSRAATGQRSSFARPRHFRSDPPPDVKTFARSRPSSRTPRRWCDTDYVVKLFRRLEPGINPEIEIGRFLTETVAFPNTPPLLGAVELIEDGNAQRSRRRPSIRREPGRRVDGHRRLSRSLRRRAALLAAEARSRAMSRPPTCGGCADRPARRGDAARARQPRRHCRIRARSRLPSHDVSAGREQFLQRARACSIELARRRAELRPTTANWCEMLIDRARDRSPTDAANCCPTRRRHEDPPSRRFPSRPDADREGRRVHHRFRRRAAPQPGRAPRKAPAARDVAGLIRSIDYSTTAALERALKSAPDDTARSPRARRLARCCRRRIPDRLPRSTDRRRGYGPRSPQEPSGCSISSCWRRRFTRSNTSWRIGRIGCGVPLAGTWRILSRGAGWPHERSSPEAYAVHRGPPFRSVPLSRPAHRGRRAVVRVFLPDAEEVSVDRRARPRKRTPPHPRRRAVRRAALPTASQRYRVRARFGDSDVELEDPYRFPPMLSDFDLYLLGEGTHLSLYDKLGAHPMVLDGVAGVAFVVLRARRAGGSAWSAISISGTAGATPCGCAAMASGKSSSPASRPGDKYKYEIIGARRAHAAVEVRSGGVRSRSAAEDRLDRRGSQRHCRGPQPARRASMRSNAPMSIYEVHLGSWRRHGRSEGSRWLTYREMAEQLPRLCARHGLHPCRVPADERASVRRLLGLSADRNVRAHQPFRQPGRFRTL